MLTIQTILHPTDFSEHSTYALQLASLLARESKAKLILLHVAMPPAVGYGEVISDLATAAQQKEAKDKLLALRPAYPGLRYEHVILQGDAADGILHVAQQERCELIIMGSHGRRGVTRLLLGSVAEQVMRKAACPVLIAKKPMPEEPVKWPSEALAQAPAIP